MHSIAEATFRKIFTDLKEQGKHVAPRGQEVIELEHYTYQLPAYVRFQSFEDRKLNLNYIKNEVLWYLRANKYDTSITKHASMWKSLVNTDGSINSNYGQYVFGLHFDDKSTRFTPALFDVAVETLKADKDSRRASIVILQPYHLNMKTNDVPCTYSLNFRIRENKLNMSVHMRSQDAVFGMGNDAPTFSIIHEMLFTVLKDTYPELELGIYYHTADSFHIYARHFELLDKITSGSSKYIDVQCPKITSSAEVEYLRAGIHKAYDDGLANSMFIKDLKLRPEHEFSAWLLDNQQ